jgi:fructose-1,6-bisphosphatase/inositol monophosphatase family enzyme
VTDWNVRAILELLIESGRIAMEHYERPRISLKDDRTVVTEADHAIERLLTSELESVSDSVFFVGEETVGARDENYVQAALDSTAWIVDPIDGTAPYSQHIPTWGISIGFARKGRLVEGAIHLPTTGELFLSSGGQLLYGVAGQEPAPAPVREITDPDRGMIALTQWMAKKARLDLPNPVQALGTAVLPLAYLCLGRYEGYVGSLKLWDFAGSLPLLLACGVRVEMFGVGPVDGRIDSRFWQLHDGPDRWKARGPLVAGRTDRMVNYLTEAIAAHRRAAHPPASTSADTGSSGGGGSPDGS